MPTLLAALLTLFAGLVVAVVPTQRRAGASAQSDRSQIALLEQRIAAAGAGVQRLVQRYDEVQARAASLKVRLAATHAQLSADQRAQSQAAAQLRTVAVEAYVSGGGLEAPALLSSSASTQGMASVYVDVAGERLRGAIDTFQYTQSRTQATAGTLVHQEAQAQATMRALAPDQRSAEAAVAADDRLLSRVKGNLAAVLRAAEARRAAAQAAAERRMAERAAAAVAASERPARSLARQVVRTTSPAPSTPGTTSAPSTTSAASPSVTTTPSLPASTAPSPAPGGYANPLRALGGVSPERIDQGVDYGGYGPIYALGDGVVLSTYNGGWPGGTFIAYRLTDGPAAGLVVYAAEDIYPSVQVGETVTAATQIGDVYGGPDGIETGWAAPGGLGDTMAATYGQFDGANSTAFGFNFSQLLQLLGAPGGVLQNSPATGALPAGWPSW